MSYDDHVKHVDGADRGDVIVFALSTCIWCKRAKALLQELGVKYRYLDVDTLEYDDKEQLYADLGQRLSFPTVLINGSRWIKGFQEDEITEALGK